MTDLQSKLFGACVLVLLFALAALLYVADEAKPGAAAIKEHLVRTISINPDDEIDRASE